MAFRVFLKIGNAVVVDAEKFVVDKEVYFFSISASGLVASFPVTNVLYVVKESPKSEGA